jgi:hypothetical protein
MENMNMARLGSSIGAGFAALLFQLPAAAQVVVAGSDLLVTPAGGMTYEDFSGTPIPAGFFGVGSDPFIGTVRFRGVPLVGTGVNGHTDTIVRRNADAMLTACPSAATVPIEIVALSLVSVSPITVTFGGGANSATYEVGACLSSAVNQQPGGMQIIRSHVNGGTFSSGLPVQARLTFTRCTTNTAAAVGSALADPGPPVVLSTGLGVWTYSSLGLPIDASPGGMIDHDCNTTTASVAFGPSSNFVTGVDMPGADCTNPGGPSQKRLTPEMAMLAAHGVLPNNRPPGVPFGFGDGTGTPCPCLNSGLLGHGCNNSYGTGGGLLYGAGIASVGADTLELKAESMQPTGTVLFFQANGLLGGGLGVAVGDGVLAITGGIVRLLPVEFAVCGKANRGAPYGDPSIAVQGGAVPGGTKYYQVYYRNPPAFCTPATWNYTNAYGVVWQP